MLSGLVCRTHLRPAAIHPLLRSFAGECGAVLVRLLAYVGGIALLAVVAIHWLGDLSVKAAPEPALHMEWSATARTYPAFAVTQADLPGKTESYDGYRHPEGGRKDVIRWTADGQKPVFEIELYRPGAELRQAGPPAAEIAARMDPDATREIAGAGVIESKFGPVALLGFVDRGGNSGACLGFMKNFEDANLRISGWTCQDGTIAARRAAIACLLNRLVLLTAANEPKLAELFARAELKRGACAVGSAGVVPADWLTGTDGPRLRGRL